MGKRGMRFNVSKCYLMSININKHPYSCHFTSHNHVLEQVDENQYFVVIMHQNINKACRINQILTKANSVLLILMVTQ